MKVTLSFLHSFSYLVLDIVIVASMIWIPGMYAPSARAVVSGALVSSMVSAISKTVYKFWVSPEVSEQGVCDGFVRTFLGTGNISGFCNIFLLIANVVDYRLHFGLQFCRLELLISLNRVVKCCDEALEITFKRIYIFIWIFCPFLINDRLFQE